MLSRFNRVAQEVHEALDSVSLPRSGACGLSLLLGRVLRLVHRADQAAPASDDREQARAACENVVSVFEGALRLLSPFMPFITEELWHAVYDGNPPLKSIALAAYPQADEKQIDTAAETEMAILQDLIAGVRNIRAELKVEQQAEAAD